MSHWDGKKVIKWEPISHEGYPDWEGRDCGCCAGVQWGGEVPRPCSDCAEGGRRWVHLPTGTVAAWPGGPLLGARVPALTGEDAGGAGVAQ